MTPMEAMHGFYESVDDLLLTLRAARGESAHLIEARRLAWAVERMPRAEFVRRCGYRFPLPAHMRRQDGH